MSAVRSLGKGPLGITDQHRSQPLCRQHENDIGRLEEMWRLCFQALYSCYVVNSHYKKL